MGLFFFVLLEVFVQKTGCRENAYNKYASGSVAFEEARCLREVMNAIASRVQEGALVPVVSGPPPGCGRRAP
jgi:hypothetical protein